MIIAHKENITANFAGTIIDIESRGEFDRQYRRTNDSREYQHIQQVIFGFVNQQYLNIFCADGADAIGELKEKAGNLIDSLPRPLYAFQSAFERGVIFHHLGKQIVIDGELQAYRGEAKVNAVMELGIPNYNDPFHDVGKLCMIAWMRGEFENAIAHNRACLLKERDILVRRGFRPPDELKFIPAQITSHD